MMAGELFGYYCCYDYKHIDGSAHTRFPADLKGVDHVVYTALRTLGLQTKVALVMEIRHHHGGLSVRELRNYEGPEVSGLDLERLIEDEETGKDKRSLRVQDEDASDDDHNHIARRHTCRFENGGHFKHDFNLRLEQLGSSRHVKGLTRRHHKRKVTIGKSFMSTIFDSVRDEILTTLDEVNSFSANAKLIS